MGNSPVPGEFPTQRPVTRSFDVFFDLCLNKRLSKQSWGWWFETPSRPLWRHRNVRQEGVSISNNKVHFFYTYDLFLYEVLSHICVMKESLHWKSFCITGTLWGQSAVTDGCSAQLTSNTNLSCFLCCQSQQRLTKQSRCWWNIWMRDVNLTSLQCVISTATIVRC